MALPAPSSMNVAKAQEHYVQIFSSEFHLNWAINVVSADRNVFTHRSKVWLFTAQIFTKPTIAQWHSFPTFIEYQPNGSRKKQITGRDSTMSFIIPLMHLIIQNLEVNIYVV
jgi:hypothetical protein